MNTIAPIVVQPAPIPTREPTAAEIAAKIALAISMRQGHARVVAAAVGVSAA